MDSINEDFQSLRQAVLKIQEAQLLIESVLCFLRDADDVIAWINLKENRISSDEIGRYNTALRRLEDEQRALENELSTLENQVSKLNEKAKELCETHREDFGAVIDSKEQEISRSWNKLLNASKIRKENLKNLHLLFNFYTNCEDLIDWIHFKMADILHEDTAGDDVFEMIEKHEQRKEEIDEKQEDFGTAKLQASQLLQHNNQQHASNVIEKLKSLEDEKLSLIKLWEKHRTQYEEAKDLQLFHNHHDQIESWMETLEEILFNDDSDGDSVNEHIEMLDDLKNSFEDEESTLNTLDEVLAKMLSEEHPDADDVMQIRVKVRERYEILVRKFHDRHSALKEAYGLKQLEKAQSKDRTTDQIKGHVSFKNYAGQMKVTSNAVAEAISSDTLSEDLRNSAINLIINSTFPHMKDETVHLVILEVEKAGFDSKSSDLQDLGLIRESDLESVLKPIQRRKLVQTFQMVATSSSENQPIQQLTEKLTNTNLSCNNSVKNIRGEPSSSFVRPECSASTSNIQNIELHVNVPIIQLDPVRSLTKKLIRHTMNGKFCVPQVS